MKFNDYVVVIAINAVITGLIVSYALSNRNKPIQSTDSLQQGNLQGPQVQSMDDHHKPQPTDSSTFDSLVDKESPDFTLEDYNGKKVNLSNLKGKNVVLFFNEGLMCYPACWNQIAAFGKDSRFDNDNTITLSIVVDEKKEWKQAIDKMPELTGVTVLFDTNRLVSQMYGVLALNSSMHRGQFPGHTYVIIDKEGIIRFTQDDYQMAVRNDELAGELKKI